jgi:hypothetical protein
VSAARVGVRDLAVVWTQEIETGMSTELERLEAQLKRSFEGEAWHGPSVLEALKDVTPQMAGVHHISGAHSIWELVLHLSGTYRWSSDGCKGRMHS